MTHLPSEPVASRETGTQAPIRRTWDPGPLVEVGGGVTRDVARQLGIAPALLCRPLSDSQADKYATRLGLHPTQVWGMTWLE